MRLIQPFWERCDNAMVAYPGQQQGDNPRCVFASIASAVNWSAGNQANLRAQQLFNDWQRNGGGQPTFDNIAPLATQRIAGVRQAKYSNRATETPIPLFDLLCDSLHRGAVLIMSLQIAELRGQDAVRHEGWHMLSIFAPRHDIVQVWDTNGEQGCLALADVEELLTTDSCAHRFSRRGQPEVNQQIVANALLVAHDQHECLLISA